MHLLMRNLRIYILHLIFLTVIKWRRMRWAWNVASMWKSEMHTKSWSEHPERPEWENVKWIKQGQEKVQWRNFVHVRNFLTCWKAIFSMQTEQVVQLLSTECCCVHVNNRNSDSRRASRTHKIQRQKHPPLPLPHRTSFMYIICWVSYSSVTLLEQSQH
jgi:hypothetical protein